MFGSSCLIGDECFSSGGKALGMPRGMPRDSIKGGNVLEVLGALCGIGGQFKNTSTSLDS